MSLAQSYEESPFVMASRQTIAANVRAQMGRRQVSQTAVANALGMSQPVVSRRVRGEIPFDTDELIALANFLDCDFADLVEDVRSRCFSPDLSLVPPFDGQQGQLDLGLPPTSRADLQLVHP